MAPLWDRGTFRTSYCDLTERLGGAIIGATVFETDAGYTEGPYHFHDGIEEWMYVVAGAPVLRDPSGKRTLQPGTLVAFSAGPGGAHTFDGPGRVVMFSAGSRGRGEAYTSVYVDADKIGGKSGIQFLRASALETWSEPSIAPVAPAPAGPCPQVDLLSFAGDDPSLSETLHTQTWRPSLVELAAGEAAGPYHYDWCREHWALVVAGALTLRRPSGSSAMVPGDIVCLAEGEPGAHQFVNESDGPVRLLFCTAPVQGPWATVEPDQGTYTLRVPGQMGYRFSLTDRLADYWDGEPGADGA